MELKLVDPIADYPHEIDFSDVHYFMNPSWTAKPGEYLWLLWLGDMKSIKVTHLLMDEHTGLCDERSGTEQKRQVVGMVELQKNPDDSNEVWLKFFEVTPEFKGQGFSGKMIADLISQFKQHFPGKMLMRSRPSDEGAERLKDRLTGALQEAEVPFSWSGGLRFD